MKVHLEMAAVATCAASECAYNVDASCHAQAITVGDGVHPACDTYLKAGNHVRDTTPHAGVGACKVASCRHNRDYECHARSIAVRRHGHHADCATFEAA
jgi:hypothetical protein